MTTAPRANEAQPLLRREKSSAPARAARASLVGVAIAAVLAAVAVAGVSSRFLLASSAGSLDAADIPDRWNGEMKTFLDVDVPDDASGALQDIHWSFGAIGYFPSYTLGAIMAVQIFNAAQADLGDAVLKGQIARGEFGPLREWLRDRVHSVGSIHASPDELLTAIAGEPVSPRPFLEYLTAKYEELYQL